MIYYNFIPIFLYFIQIVRKDCFWSSLQESLLIINRSWSIQQALKAGRLDELVFRFWNTTSSNYTYIDISAYQTENSIAYYIYILRLIHLPQRNTPYAYFNCESYTYTYFYVYHQCVTVQALASDIVEK